MADFYQMHHFVLDIGISHSFLLWQRLSYFDIVSKLFSLTSLKLLQTKSKKGYLGMGRKYTTFLKVAMQYTIENFNIFKKDRQLWDQAEEIANWGENRQKKKGAVLKHWPTSHFITTGSGLSNGSRRRCAIDVGSLQDG